MSASAVFHKDALVCWKWLQLIKIRQGAFSAQAKRLGSLFPEISPDSSDARLLTSSGIVQHLVAREQERDERIREVEVVEKLALKHCCMRKPVKSQINLTTQVTFREIMKDSFVKGLNQNFEIKQVVTS